MCGIAGYVGFDDVQLLRAMGASLLHRGPDDAGFYTAPGIGLAHRRLSIIDLKSGHQPMANEDQTVWTVFNGEIYNYEDIRRRLIERGHHFATTSDTEVIVHLYEDEGLDFVQRFRGMFALAVWDARRRRLVLARDRIGEKPLFYAVDGAQLVFGSEIKAILQRPGQRTVKPQAVCDFLAMGYVPAPYTFYEGIQKLPPGHLLVHENAQVRLAPYWQRGQRYGNSISFEQAKQELTDRLSEVVKLCLKSDVEVGGFLSGGIDSSTIVALMRRHAAQVQTFAVGFGGAAKGYNELSYAKLVADRVGSTHHELILEARSSVELLPKILWHYDEPHGEPTSVLVYLLCEFTKRFVKVALGGTGGDEIFYGYPRFAGIRVLEYYRMLPRIVRRHVVDRIVQRWPETSKGGRFANHARRFVEASDLAPNEAYLNWVSLLHREIRMALLSETITANAEDPWGESVLREYLCGSEDRGLLDRAADLDIGGYLPEYQLCYMDRMSMAHGLEVRSPLCDYDLVDFVTSLPFSYRLKGRRSKHIFKEVAVEWIPRNIVNRRKRGFDSPIGEWIKGELRGFMETFLSQENLKRSGLLNAGQVAKLLGDHLAGRRNYSLQLWSILALEAWYRMYIEDNVTDVSSYSLRDMRGTKLSADQVFVRRAKCNGAVRKERSSLLKAGGPRITRKRLWDSTPRLIRQLLRPGLDLFGPAYLLGREFRRQKAFADAVQYWPSDQAKAYQLEQLQRLCQLAYEKSAYYQQAFNQCGFRPDDLRSVDDILRLPTTDRRIVRDQLEAMCTGPLDSRNVEVGSTGGTGGEPVWFALPVGRSAVEYAYLVSSWQRIGFSLETPLAVFRGRVVRPDRRALYHEYDPLLRHHYYSAFHLTDENMARYLEHVATIGPCFLHVYPSSVATLARFCHCAGICPPGNIRGIIAESEIVYLEQRRMVEETFGCRYFSCYGHSEKLVLASECEHSNDYHVWPTYGYFELLDESGNPVTTPGQRGEVVGTGFVNTVMPFIRYRTGDWATYVGDRCEACGREHVIIRDIRGHRTQEVLITANGSEISWTALNMHDDTFIRVRQFQFAQDKPGQAVLRIVPAAGFGERDANRIHHNLGRKLDGQLTFTVELVDAIPLSARGKAIYVDQRIPHEQRALLDLTDIV
jgi:asparagine synthase (glutamine-hydrolysing)